MAEQKSHIIQGVLKDKGGIATSGLTVHVFIDTTKTKPQLIGQTTSDEKGKYQIEYDAEKLKEFDMTGEVRIIVKVLSKENKVLKDTSRRMTKTGSQTVNITDIDYVQLNPKQLSRLETLKYLVSDKDLKTKVDFIFKAAKGDWSAARDSLKKEKVSEKTLNKLDFTFTLADLTDDQPLVAKEITKSCNNLREVALKFNVESLTKLAMDTKADLGSIEGETAEEKEKNYTEKVNNYVISLNRKLYQSEPSAVLQRMVSAAELPIADVGLHNNIVKFFNNQPDFNISTTSIYTALSQPNALKNIAEDQWEGVTHQLKILQRVQAISPTPEAIPVLMKANLNSAYHVAELPESAFLKSYGNAKCMDKECGKRFLESEIKDGKCPKCGSDQITKALLGETTARQVYQNAVNNRVRNEHALMSLRELYRGSGVAFIDQHQYGHQSAIDPAGEMQKITDTHKVPLNWENLFGSVDLCECEECNSVYSPAAYFVELL